jgi:hypothetical protein
VAIVGESLGFGVERAQTGERADPENPVAVLVEACHKRTV